MKKILIIRFSSIGDIVLTSPVVRCVKDQLNAEVHYVTKRQFAAVVESNPQIDKVWTIEKEITEIVSELKLEAFDFVVDLHNNLRSTRLKSALKRPSAAFPKLNSKKWLLTNFKWDLLPAVHVVDRYFEAVKKLGVVNDQKGLDYFIPTKDEVDFAAHSIPEKFIAFSIGAKFATKRLHNEKIIEIISNISMPVIILGGKEDEENAAIIHKNCPSSINLVGKFNLNQSAFILKKSQKVVSFDTGLMHIASAFKKPIISIWGNTVPALGMYPYLPKNSNLSQIFEVQLACRPCSKIGFQSCPKKHFKCMNNQDAQAISAAINS